MRRWVRQYRSVGHVRPRVKAGGTPSDIWPEELEAILARRPDANAGEIAAEYNRGRRGRNRRHVSSIKRALYRAGYVVNKNVFVRSSSCAPMSSPGGEPLGAGSDASIRVDSSLSTNRGSTRQ